MFAGISTLETLRVRLEFALSQVRIFEDLISKYPDLELLNRTSWDKGMIHTFKIACNQTQYSTNTIGSHKDLDTFLYFESKHLHFKLLSSSTLLSINDLYLSTVKMLSRTSIEDSDFNELFNTIMADAVSSNEKLYAMQVTL